MVKKFESEISYVMLIVLFIIIGGVSFLGTGFSNWTAVKYVTSGGMLLVWLYTAYSFFNTEYHITETELILTVKPFYKKKIPIANIRRVEKSSSLMSSPAPSFKRLEILYNTFDSELVSPKDQKAFAEMLQQLNPEIVIKL